MAFIYKKDKMGISGCADVNFLFNDGKFYIMDNHLFAIWCWNQKIKTKCRYGIFHIDRHYDLLNNLSDDFLIQNHDNLESLAFDYFIQSIGTKKIRYDNYIDAFKRSKPNCLEVAYYATHKNGIDWRDTSMKDISDDAKDVDIWDLPTNVNYWMSDNVRWILNIDIDFFFQDMGGSDSIYQFLTDKYIVNLCRNIRKVLPLIEVITIALSPEFCGGWSNSYKILKKMSEELDFNLPFYLKNIDSQTLIVDI